MAAANQVDAQPTAKYVEDKGDKRCGEAPTDGWSAINSILITIFTGVLAYLAYRQWCSMQRQTEYLGQTMKETRKAADAANLNATTLMNTERAWLLLEKVQNPKIGTGPVAFGYTLKNYGRTPAFLTKMVAQFRRYKSLDSLPENPEDATPNQEVQLPERGIAVASDMPLNDVIIELAGIPILSAEEILMLREGALFLYASVFILYRDIYEREFTTAFGGVYQMARWSDGFEGFVRTGPPAYNKHT